MSTENVKVELPFTQVCVWPGTIVGPEHIEAFEQWLLDDFGARGKYLEEIKTLPDMEDGYPVEGTGGRTDLFFVIHREDVGKFAVPRLQFGMRWVEDVIANEKMRGEISIYPERVKEYRTW